MRTIQHIYININWKFIFLIYTLFPFNMWLLLLNKIFFNIVRNMKIKQAFLCKEDIISLQKPWVCCNIIVVVSDNYNLHSKLICIQDLDALDVIFI